MKPITFDLVWIEFGLFYAGPKQLPAAGLFQADNKSFEAGEVEMCPLDPKCVARSGVEQCTTGCGSGSSCAPDKYSDTQWGCCMKHADGAVGCNDGFHCCAKGLECMANGTNPITPQYPMITPQ